jgi:hypothetical protein
MPQGWVHCTRRAIWPGVLPHGYRVRSALGGEGHECDVASSLDSCAKLALMSSTVSGDTAWNDFPSLGDQVPQTLDIFVIDINDLV